MVSDGYNQTSRITLTLPRALRIRSTLLIGASLAVAGGLSRLAYVRDTPINWDAVQFALALDRFDLHLHQPHPPGYILYVLMGRALQAAVGDPALSLSLLSVLFSAISLPVIYRLALDVFDEQGIAVGAALLLLGSPLALYYGSVGLTYVPEMTLSMCVAGLAWALRAARKGGAHSRGRKLALLLGVALGIAGGVRQTSMLVLLPLCVWALWGGRFDRRAWAGFWVSLVVTCLLWFVPLVALSGGLVAYLHENVLLAQVATARTSLASAGIEGLVHNLGFEALSVVMALAFGAVPLGLWAVRLIRFGLAPELRAFLTWWAAPPLLFFALSHLGQYGYVLVVLPPLVLMSAVAARVLGERLAGWSFTRSGEIWGALICAGLAALSAGYFALAQGPATASSITHHDRHWRAVRSALRDMDPASTVLVMDMDWQGPFRIAGYTLPAFCSYAAGDVESDARDAYGWRYWACDGRSNYSLPHPPPQPYLPLPPGIHTVVALDDTTAQKMQDTGEPGPASSRQSGRTLTLEDGSTLYVLTSEGSPIRGLMIQGESIRVIP
jgi:hypothetical protein